MALPFYKESTDEYELQFAVNHLGHFYLTNLLLPKLKSSKARVINLASSAHRNASFKMYDTFLNYAIKQSSGPLEEFYKPWVNYAISKACNIFFTRESQRRWGQDGVTSVSVHPGMVSTDLARSIKPNFVETLYL